MGTGAITHSVDVAQLVLYAFWIFFFGLVFYLQRESHREGYPMDSDRGVIEGWPVPRPKTFKLHDGSEVSFPNDKVSPQTLNAQPASPWATGFSIVPVGNPLSAGVGPGAWADRADVVEIDLHGNPRIIPLRVAEGYGVAEGDIDPRGSDVAGADGEIAGVVVDLWVDTADMLFRFLEVQLAQGGRVVLLPWNFARISRGKPVRVHALYAPQFADVPGTKSPVAVSMLEEEKICAYFGAGLLYADADRAEPLI
jgi:photosynthetic reaction center H subunit